MSKHNNPIRKLHVHGEKRCVADIATIKKLINIQIIPN